MPRANDFTRKIKAAAHLRAGGKCEGVECGAKLKTGEGEVDHKIEAHDGGDATLENAQVLCAVCHKAKTAAYVKRIRKAERVRDKVSGALTSKNPLPASKGFTPALPQAKARKPLTKQLPPRRSLYA